MADTKRRGQKPEKGSEGFRTELAPSLQSKRTRIVWSIAGFDPSSGAGVTADLMTFAAWGLFGCAAITALTVQTTQGVFGSEPVSADLLTSTLDRLDEDLSPVGVKIGMLATTEAAHVVAAFLKRVTDKQGRRPLVVLDPVLRSSSGRALYPEAGVEVLRRELLPLVDWVTPNWAELSVLSGREVSNLATAETASWELADLAEELCVVATGGDQEHPTDLIAVPGRLTEILHGRRVETTSTHGTGCAFSSALLSALVHGAAPVEAVKQAKQYVEEALRQAPGLGAGRGPLELLWPVRHTDLTAD